MKLSLGLLCCQLAVAASLKFDLDLDHIPADRYCTDEIGACFERSDHPGKPPFYFSVPVRAEGNYRVTVKLGDQREATVTTVKAELRRLMLERVRTAPGQFVTRTFVVNVRHTQIAGGGEVRLKPRETGNEAWAWDDRLTLEFTDEHPAVKTIEIQKDDTVPTLYIAGDSTSTDQPVCASIEESADVAMPDGAKETVHTFGWYIRKFIADAKAKGATAILSSPTIRNIWAGGKVERATGHFGEWDSEIAKVEKLAFLDHSNATADVYETMGPEKVKALFPQDHTHTSVEGADLNASLVVAALKGVGSPLVAFLSAKGQAVQSYPTPLETGIARLHLPEPANPHLPTLFFIGDSTVRNGRGDGANGQWGWGEPIFDFFDSSKINVVNRAVGGLSSRTYLTQGHWDRVLAMLKPGDFVMMQFGHNDDGPLNDASRARGTIKGTGDEVQEIDNQLTKQHEVVHSFGWYLKKFIADARAKGATPIVCSLIPRKIWKDGKIARNSEDYGKWAAEVAASEKTPFVDLNEIIALRYDRLGPEKVEPLFADPHTHTSRAGAELNGECVIAGLKGLKNNPLAPYFAGKAAAIGAQH